MMRWRLDPCFFRAAFSWFVLWSALVFTAHAAPPGWIKDCLQTDVSEWSSSNTLVVLLDSSEVRYLATDKVSRKMRAVVRVTKEGGQHNALAALSYNSDTDRVKSARAWIISPDGKKTDVYGRPSFIEVSDRDQYVWSSQRALVFNGRDTLGVGSVLAWEFEVEANAGIFDASHEFLSEHPVVSSQFEVTPMSGGRLIWAATSSQIPAPVSGSAVNSLRWKMNRINGAARERPSGFLPNPQRVSVRCVKPAESASSTGTWAGLGDVVADIIEPRIVVSDSVKTEATRLTREKSARWDRIRAITEFVQRDVPYLSLTLDRDSLAGYRPHLPAEVLRRRLGDCKDKASLVAAMLRAIGDNAHVVLVHAQNPTALSPDWPSAYFNHAIVGIPADDAVPQHWPVIDGGRLGRLVLFDATDPGTPLGVLPYSDQGGYGLIAAKETPGLIRLPVIGAEHNGWKRITSAELKATGDIVVKAEENYRGYLSARLHETRFNMGEDNFTRFLEKRFSESMPSVTALRWKDGWNQTSSEYRLNLEFTGERYARRSGRDMLLVCPRIFAGRSSLDPWKVKLEGAAWIPPEDLHEELRLRLPDGFAVVEVPTAWDHESALFSCRVRYRIEGRELIYEQSLQRKSGVLEKADYEALRLITQKLEDAERRPMILRRTI
jgi:hypothetical protein